MSEDDYCVYARNILGRLSEIPNTTGFSTDVVNESPDLASQSISPTLMFMTVAALLMIALSLIQGSSRNKSKL